MQAKQPPEGIASCCPRGAAARLLPPLPPPRRAAMVAPAAQPAQASSLCHRRRRISCPNRCRPATMAAPLQSCPLRRLASRWRSAWPSAIAQRPQLVVWTSHMRRGEPMTARRTMPRPRAMAWRTPPCNPAAVGMPLRWTCSTRWRTQSRPRRLRLVPRSPRAERTLAARRGPRQAACHPSSLFARSG